MTYKIGKGQYAGKGNKNYPVQILNEEKKVIHTTTLYGSHQSVKKKAEKLAESFEE